MGFKSLVKRSSIKNLKDLKLSPSRSPSGSAKSSPTRSLPSSPARRFMSGHHREGSIDEERGSMTGNAALDGPIPWFLRQTKSDRSQAFIELEWQQRERLATGTAAVDIDSEWARTSNLPDTASRNRYYNIEPFAANRVRLRVESGSNDYINASPIVLGKRKYISTQGPKQNSVAHFYRMLAHETSSVAVVVMLTQTHEAGREKCFNYWPVDPDSPALELLADPDDTDDLFEGNVSLLSTETDDDARTDISHLRLRTRNRSRDGESQQQQPWEEKDVWHLHFSAWPDFSIPEGEDRLALLHLLRLSRKLNAGAKAPLVSSFAVVNGGSRSQNSDELNPRIVHCSAGVGRSGTFIALDSLLARLETGELDEVPEGTDPIVETVDRLRQQRMMMVQGESQFHFLYDVLRELWVERWRRRKGLL